MSRRSGNSRGGPPGPDPDRPVVVLLEGRGRFLSGERLFEPGPRLAVRRGARDAQPGRLALVQPPARGRETRVLRVLGRPDVAADVLEALLLDRGLRRSFPAGVEQAAREARDRPAHAEEREDLRDLPTFTIDPATARDFDDAVSAERLGDGHWRIWVHIADVSAYVRPGSPVDREAYRRGTSVYVPGKVEPMLPEALSNDACSLMPGQDRLAVTVELELRGAETVKAAFRRTLIRSDARLDYDQVDRIFAGDERAQDPWATPLAAAREASAALEAARREGGSALAIESVEAEFDFDRRGNVTGAQASVQTESHRLIEHLMIGANEAVAQLLSDRRIPALYRVHERPEAESVDRLLEQLGSLDVPTPPAGEHPSRTEAAEIVAQASVLVDEHVRRTGRGRRALTFLVLRSLQQARYDPRNLGHAGLGLTHYCHFTSPIRRYPDLICHRALLSAVGGGEAEPRVSTLADAALWTSAKEREAMLIERDADDVAQCFLLERALMERGWSEPFDGEITSLIGGGAFITFGAGDGSGPYEGFLPVRRIGAGWWELNEPGTILLSDEGGALRLGDPVRVRVRGVEAARGRVDVERD